MACTKMVHSAFCGVESLKSLWRARCKMAWSTWNCASEIASTDQCGPGPQDQVWEGDLDSAVTSVINHAPFQKQSTLIPAPTATPFCPSLSHPTLIHYPCHRIWFDRAVHCRSWAQGSVPASVPAFKQYTASCAAGIPCVTFFGRLFILPALVPNRIELEDSLECWCSKRRVGKGDLSVHWVTKEEQLSISVLSISTI